MLLRHSLSLICLLASSTAVSADIADTSSFKSIPLRTHSWTPPYLDSDMQSRWFDYGGDTVIRADQYMRLTTIQQSQSGFVFSRVPLTATNWEIEVEFKIHGPSNLHGDGMAMWITRDRAKPGPVFGHMDKFEGLGIFFDTYKNNRPGVVFPYVMAMVGDGVQSYDQGHDGKENELAGCSARGIRNADVATKARLTYFQDTSLKLQLQYKENSEWEPCFEVGSIKLPSVAYLGFSAETGELSDNHDVIRVETRNLYSEYKAPATGDQRAGGGRGAGSSKPYNIKNSQGQQQGGWGWWFLKIVLFLMVVAGAYVGYTMWRAQKRGRF